MSDPKAGTNGGPGVPEGAAQQARWDGRYQAKEAAEPAAESDKPDPPEALRRLTSALPGRGRAIDLAGGDGGGGLYLAGRGLDTTVADISPIALRRAETFAAGADVSMDTVSVDLGNARLAEVLEAIGGSTPAVITCWSYLDRHLLASVADDLPPGARFLTAIATTTNLERHDRPSPRFLLDRGELVDLVLGQASGRLRVLHRREGWTADRHRAELVVEAHPAGGPR